MPLTISVRLLTGSYEAAEAEDRDLPEWPPHPARVFCALVASARCAEDRSALAWLEGQEPPRVHASARPITQNRAGFVVTNEVTARNGNQTYPARINGLRSRVTSVPQQDRVDFFWESAEPDAGLVERLDELARRVPYLGRSTGVALVTASAHAEAPGGGNPDLELAPGTDLGTLSVFEPCDVLDADVALRVPYPGYLAELDTQHDAGRPAWEVSRSRGYRRRRPAVEAPTPAVPSVYTDLLAFRFAGLRPEGRLSPRFTEAMRSWVLKAAGREAPAVLHGHGAPGRPHVAFLALPDVGGEATRGQHADGHLLGLGVAVPELPADERRAVFRAVLGLRAEDGVTAQLEVPGVGTVELDYRPGLYRPWGAQPERWRQGSRRWVTATPVVLDRYPKRPGQDVDEIRRSCRTLGLPDPVDIQVSGEPMMAGAVRMRPGDLPRQVRGRLFRHVSLVFDRNVAGPVLLGAGRYLGVGLLAPVPEESAA